MSSITARFPLPISAVIVPVQTPDSDNKDDSPVIVLNNHSTFNFKDRFYETILSIKKLMKRIRKTQKIAARADLFSKSDSKMDPLKLISVATLPFIIIELYRTVKKVCEVCLGITIKDPLSEKTAVAGNTALGIGKRVYDAANATIKLIESTVKTNDVANETISSVSSQISVPKILNAILLPFLLFDMYSKVEKIYKVVIDESIAHLKVKISRVTDQALSIVDNCVDITQIIVSFVANTSLVAVTGFLSAINIVIEAKKLYDSAAFYRKISKRNFAVTDTSDYDFKKNLVPSDKVKCILRVDGSNEKEILLREIKKKLTKLSKANTCERIDLLAQDILGKISPEKIQAVEQVRRTTRLRSIQMITCHALKGLASSINIAAAAILFAAPPLAPASYGLLGVSSLISLSAFLINNYVGQKWEDSIVRAVKRIIVREWRAQQNAAAISLLQTAL